MAPSVVSESRPLLKPAGSHRAITDDPATVVPGDRLTLVVQARGDTVQPIRPVHIVLDILLARPYDLHRTIDLLGDFDGADRPVGLEPPAKAAADQMIVHDDFFSGQTRRLRDHRLNARDRLVADPDFAFILAEMHSAVHRLHCGMRE